MTDDILLVPGEVTLTLPGPSSAPGAALTAWRVAELSGATLTVGGVTHAPADLNDPNLDLLLTPGQTVTAAPTGAATGWVRLVRESTDPALLHPDARPSALHRPSRFGLQGVETLGPCLLNRVSGTLPAATWMTGLLIYSRAPLAGVRADLYTGAGLTFLAPVGAWPVAGDVWANLYRASSTAFTLPAGFMQLEVRPGGGASAAALAPIIPAGGPNPWPLLGTLTGASYLMYDGDNAAVTPAPGVAFEIGVFSPPLLWTPGPARPDPAVWPPHLPFNDPALGRPVWVNAARDGWIDATGTPA